ncbi:class I SAM-dependent methyltransferase [Bdellovibrio sp. HCB185ZH]|uniref:class I SAM-dependent methyltransferase n=1 Tax=Bdellovibrio sp. HCB185ZH TaxID=3394235 RepID=UPI0039A49D7A
MKAQYQTFIGNNVQNNPESNTFANIVALKGLCERDTVRHLQAVIHDYYPQVMGCSALDLSSGQGVAAMTLAELGFNVAAFDMNRDSIAILQRIAWQQDLNIYFGMGGILQIEKLQKKFDLIHESDCLVKIPHDSDRKAFLAAVQNTLVPGGKFVISTSVLTENYDVNDSFESIRMDAEHIVWRQTPDAEAPGVIQDEGKNWVAQKRLSTPAEIKLEMMNAGFEVLEEQLTIHPGNNPGTLRMVLASTSQC